VFAWDICKSFPEFDDPDPSSDDDFEGVIRCTRQCLQDCDAKGLPKNDNNTDENSETCQDFSMPKITDVGGDLLPAT